MSLNFTQRDGRISSGKDKVMGQRYPEYTSRRRKMTRLVELMVHWGAKWELQFGTRLLEAGHALLMTEEIKRGKL